jgi:hypothetical protein
VTPRLTCKFRVDFRVKLLQVLVDDNLVKVVMAKRSAQTFHHTRISQLTYPIAFCNLVDESVLSVAFPSRLSFFHLNSLSQRNGNLPFLPELESTRRNRGDLIRA